MGEKSNEARCQDTFYQSINNQIARQQSRQELVDLWRDVAPEGCTTISLADLKEYWASSKRFHHYFHSMDIDIGFLEYALTSGDEDGDGQVSFEEFAHSVVSIKNTDPGPVVAFIKHTLLDALSEVSSFKAQCVSLHQDVLKRISAFEAAAVASATGEDAKMSSPKSECIRSAASPRLAQATTLTTISTAISTVREEMLPRPRLLEHRSFPVPTNTFHPAQQRIKPTPRHLNVDGVEPAIDLDRDIAEQVHRIQSQVKHLMVAISAAEESVRIDCSAHLSELLASLSEALPGHVPPYPPSQAPQKNPTKELNQNCGGFCPSQERPEHIGSFPWWDGKASMNWPMEDDLASNNWPMSSKI